MEQNSDRKSARPADVSCSDVMMNQDEVAEPAATTSTQRRTLFGIGSTITPVPVNADSFSDFSVSECCKYCIFLLIFTFLMIIGRGDGVENYYVTQSMDSILWSNEFMKSSNIK